MGVARGILELLIDNVILLGISFGHGGSVLSQPADRRGFENKRSRTAGESRPVFG